MKNKILLVLICLVLLSISSVSASDINQTNINENDNTILSTSNDIIVDTISVSEIYGNDTLTLSNDNEILSDEGEFVDASEGYARLNAFRTENNVWQWNSDDTTKTIFNTNADNQLQPLIIDTALEETAKIRAKELVEKFSHTRPDGSSCWTAFPDGYWATGENIAMGQRTWQQVTEAWKETNDPYDGQGHRRNMLNPNFNSVGIAGYKINGVIYWAQDFGQKHGLAEKTNIRPENAFIIKNNTKNPEFKINLPNDATGDFTVRIDGNVIQEYLKDGKATITSTGLSEGSHEAIISYSGDTNYYTINQITTITVTQDTIISAQDVSIVYKDTNDKLVATIISENGNPLVVTLNVDLNGKSYSVKTDSNGKASIPVDTLKPGKYTATISYKGSGNYNASSTTAKVTVTKAATTISASDVSIAYKDSNGKLVSTIISEHGKPLVVTLNVGLNGKSYSVKTDSNGKASIPVDTLKPGIYTATISYKGSGNYKASSTTAKVTVTKAATTISASDVSIAYKDSNGKLVSTIISEHGKPLVVTLNVGLNGKSYSVKTDSNGKASIPVDTLKPGTYTATISYKGSGNYKASSTTAKITVTKAATTISTPDVSITYNDQGSELVSTIISEHGKPLVVTLNVGLNGKSYSVKTDSNGKASIPVDTLKPGIYTATISYKGSGNYKASSTTAKVTVTEEFTTFFNTEISFPHCGVDFNTPINVSTAELPSETYPASVSYEGSGDYKASSTTAKVAVTEEFTTFFNPEISVAYCGVDFNTPISVSTAELPSETLY